MWKVLLKVTNVVNAKNKHSKDAQNANQYGIAPVIAKSQTGQITKTNATNEQNN